MTPHLHNFPPRGGLLANFGPQPTHTITHMGGSLAKFLTQGGGAPRSHPIRNALGGGGQPASQGEGLEA